MNSQIEVLKEKWKDILKSNLSVNEKNFWYDAGVQIQQSVKGIVQVFYNEIEDMIVFRIFFEKFNYSISNSFSRWQLIDKIDVTNQILTTIRYSIYEEIFK